MPPAISATITSTPTMSGVIGRRGASGVGFDPIAYFEHSPRAERPRRRSGPRSVPFFFQQAFRFKRRHAPGTGRRDGLTIGAVFDITGMEHALDVRSRPAVRNDIAVRIEVQF